MPGVFISYRRADSGWVAADVAKELRATLDVRIFLDLGSIEPGERFRSVIEESLQRCVVMVVFMGKDWPGALANGTRRIDQDDDVFRAMAVIPVLLGDVQQPLEAELPSPLPGLPCTMCRLHF